MLAHLQLARMMATVASVSKFIVTSGALQAPASAAHVDTRLAFVSVFGTRDFREPRAALIRLCGFLNEALVTQLRVRLSLYSFLALKDSN